MSKYPADATSRREVVTAPVSTEEPVSQRSTSVEGPAQRAGVAGFLYQLGLRFGILYAGLFVFARVAGVMPGASGVAGYYYQFKLKCVAWVGRNVLGLDQPVTHVAGSSGDQVFDWVQVITLLGLALIGALIWMFIDRGSRSVRIASDLARIVLRYRLGTTMLGYGIEKILRQQMSEPGIFRLLQPYGESSPMGLLWTFMGQSWAYSAFTGGVELLGGMLLFFRRTTTLGALIVVAVMMNVLMMNFAFDVPVKLYSMHYLIFAAALAAPDLRRLASLFVFNRTAPPAGLARPWALGRIARYVPVVKALVLGAILWKIPVQRTWDWAERPRPERSDLYGIYEVEKFTRDGTECPPLTTDLLRWRRVGFDERGRVTVVLMNDARKNFHLQPGPHAGQFMLEPVEGNYARGEIFTYRLAGANQLSLKGTLNYSVVAIELRRANEEKLLLRERGFRWISENAFNR